MPATKAVLFDFGGTLVDYGNFMADVQATFPSVLARFGVAGEPTTLFPRFRGGLATVAAEMTTQSFYLHRDLLRQGFQQGFANLGAELSGQDLDWFMEQEAARLANVTLRHGALETLVALRQRGLYLSIVSNVDEDQFAPMLVATGLAPYVDSTLTSEAARSCKPDAGIFVAALAQAGCPAAAAVYVGDTPQHDIAGAHRVGMRAVLITDAVTTAIDRRLPFDGDGKPDAIISELPELVSLLFPT